MMTPDQCRAARALLHLTQAQLAQRAGVTGLTVRKFESGRHNAAPATVNLLRLTLQDAGIQFIGENGGGVGVRFSQKR